MLQALGKGVKAASRYQFSLKPIICVIELTWTSGSRIFRPRRAISKTLVLQKRHRTQPRGLEMEGDIMTNVVAVININVQMLLGDDQWDFAIECQWKVECFSDLQQKQMRHGDCVNSLTRELDVYYLDLTHIIMERRKYFAYYSGLTSSSKWCFLQQNILTRFL